MQHGTTNFGVWDFKPFSELKTQVSYLVEALIEEHAPYVFCAQLKTMKTRVLVDLAVSLASGGNFLGKYPCQKSKVLLACAEDGEALIRRNCLLVAQSRNILIDELGDLHVMAKGGRIDEASLGYLERCLDASGPGTVLMIDPAKDYFGGLEPTSQALSFLLGQLRDTCRRYEATPILSCHSTKSAESLDLAMMQGTAYASVAGGWWLMRRRGKYRFDGVHALEVQHGGRTGCAGSFDLKLDEKLVQGEPSGHDITLTLGSSKHQADPVDKRKNQVDAVFEVVKKATEPMTCCAIYKSLTTANWKISQASVESALKTLTAAGDIQLDPRQHRHGGKLIRKYLRPESSLSA